MKLDKHQQLLVITMEEAGEVVQACSKILRRGRNGASLLNNPKQMDDLQDEIGDIYCMIQLLIDSEFIDKDKLEDRVIYKKKKLQKWSSIDVRI
tara:strand:+ start:1106 stop:1387 length:282 start_codon:yes stop_codon:yes gene_type:complete